MTRRAVLIGLGAIGMAYDLVCEDPSTTTTHARAVQMSQDFLLAAGVDPDRAARDRFTASFDVKSAACIAECAGALAGALVIVAAPDSEHLPVISEVLDRAQPAAILCEKPMGGSSDDAERILAACNSAQVPLWVNYIRRTDPGFHDALRRLSVAPDWEFIVDVGFSGDLRHLGCHFVDLLALWFGDLIDVGPTLPSGSLGRSVAWDLVMSRARVRLRQFTDGASETYTISVKGPAGSMRYAEPEGVFHWRVPGCSAAVAVQCDPAHYQRRALEHVHEAMGGRDALIATGIDAVRVHQMIDRIEACT